MPFDTAQLFVVAHDDGATKQARSTQLNLAQVSFTADPAILAWTINGVSLNGGPVLSAAVANALFSVTPDPAAPDPTDVKNGSVNVKLLGLNNAELVAFLDGFINGGSAVLGINSDGGTKNLTVRLRALKTTDFVFDGSGATPNVARHAHRVGVTGNNIGFAGAETAANYTVLIAQAFNLATHAPLAGYQIAAPMTAAGALTLDAAGTPPAQVDNQLRITHTATGKVSILPANIFVPTDLIVLMDRSGSMGASVGPGSSKWSVASDVGSLFSLLFGTMIPTRNVVGGTAATLAAYNRTAIGRFHWAGGAEVVSIGAFASAGTSPSVPADVPGGGTPIGMALEDAAAKFVDGADALSVAAKWRRRQLVLLTDGMDNSGSPRLHELTATQVPALSDDLTTGVVLHNISYARTGDIQVAALSTLVAGHNGSFDSTETNPALALAPEVLRAAFLSLLSDILPVEKVASSGAPATPIPVEPGVDRLMLVATLPGAVLGATVGGSVVGGGTTGSGNGYSWLILENPVAGDYLATSVPAGAQVHAFVDLSLRSHFGADATGVGQEMRLWATLNYNGAPVRGADVTVVQRSPSESLGEVLTNFARRGGIPKAIRRKVLDPQALQLALGAAKGQLSAQDRAVVDAGSVRRQLLEAAERSRGLDFQQGGTVRNLVEVAPGQYEAHVPASETQHENVYTFEFRAEGLTPECQPFARSRRLSKALLEAPAAQHTETSLVNTAPPSAPPRWVATVMPKDSRGRPLGPGLVPLLSFGYLDSSDKKLPKLDITDNLDGTYSTTLETEPGKLPKFGLFWNLPGVQTEPVVVRERVPSLKKVRVQLEKVLIIDDKEPFFKGTGELVFEARVSPNGSPTRSITTRLPRKGHYSAKSGEHVDINTVIFEGYVEEGSALSIAISGEELDWPRCFDRNDPLTRYVRVLPLAAGGQHFGPSDEPNDPESLSDWQVWYSVKVD